MMSKSLSSRKTFLIWLRTNAIVFTLAFLVVTILANVGPAPATTVANAWFTAVKATGIRQVSEFTVKYDAFIHVLQRNTFSTFLQLVAGALGVAPISLGVLASFYGLVAFVKPSYGATVTGTDAFLIISEGAAFILAASLTSTVASQMFGIEPGFGKAWFRSLLKASQSNFRKSKQWTPIVRKHGWLIAIVSGVIILSLLTGAWIEAIS